MAPTPSAPLLHSHRTGWFDAHRTQAEALARKFTRNHRVSHADEDDYRQVALKALWCAIASYPDDAKHPFAAHLNRCVKHNLCRYRENQGNLIRLPVRRQAQIRALMRAQSDFMAEHGRAPSNAELAANPGLSHRTLHSTRDAMRTTTVSLDTTVTPGSDLRLADLLADPEPGKDADADALHAHLKAAMNTLAPRDRDLLERHFGLSAHQAKTCEALAAVFGCSRSTLSERKTAALARLRVALAPIRAEFQIAGRTHFAA